MAGLGVGVPLCVDVEHVVVAASGGGDVEDFPGGGGRYECVGAVDGPALGPVHGRRIAKLDVLGDVGGGEHDLTAPVLSADACGPCPTSRSSGASSTPEPALRRQAPPTLQGRAGHHRQG